MAKDNSSGKEKQTELSAATGLIDRSLEQVLHESMLPYAEYVILDRALPRVEDGLKPVQRRILFTMYNLGITPDKPYRKSARIVGDCLGKYHPHGDRSVYDAMVRMAQDFNIRMPLVDGHGNFGSVDGDTAAAMRYTEARMAPLAMELLRDLDKDTVKFSLNFDDSCTEPDMLPGRYPNLLVNGASGIAVGLATNIPPHNLGEAIDAVVAYIDNPDITLRSLMKIIKGPDFPTGGFVVGGSELEKAYDTGRGKLIMRAKIAVENAENDKKNIVITELPYQVNKANLLQSILHLKEDKKDQLAGIYDICDESDRTGMRAVIRVRKDYDPNEILNVLYKYSDLQTSFGVNIVAIADGKPQQMGLIDIIYYYVNYQRNIILRRTRFELAEAKEREHILEGLVIAVRNIDEVIKIIKTSQNTGEARERLRERFKLSERQAQAVLDMRLARLTSLEIYKLEEELKEVKKLISELQAILASKKAQMEVVKKEMLAIRRQYKDARRTVVVSDLAEVQVESDVQRDSVIQDFAVVMNAGGGLKRVPFKNYNNSQRSLGDKTGLYDIAALLVETQNNATLLMLTNRGNCYKVECAALPENRWREKGSQLKNIVKDIQDGETVVAIVPMIDELPSGNLLFFTKQGNVKKTPWSEYNVLKSAYQAIKLKDGDEVVAIENDAEGTTMLFVTENGMCLNASKDDLPVQGRVAGGVRGIALSDGDAVIFAGQAGKTGEVFAASDKAFFKRVSLKEIEVLGRSRKGVKLFPLGKDVGERLIFAACNTLPAQLALADEGGNIIPLSSEDIPMENKALKPKTLKAYKKGFKVTAAYRHRSEGQYITIQTKE